MVQALGQLQHLVALHEAVDAVHQVMHIAPYCSGGMVTKIVVYLATFFTS
jgi:hypothetical protein